MDIQSLRVMLTDADLNEMARKFLPRDAPVKDLRLSIDHAKVQLSGSYPKMMMNIPFSTTWEPSIVGGRFRLRLTATSIVGLPAGILNGIFLDSFRKAATKISGVQVEGDGLLIDVDRLLASKGIPLRTNLKSVRCETGRMTIEA
jgi:hypothetical protein